MKRGIEKASNAKTERTLQPRESGETGCTEGSGDLHCVCRRHKMLVNAGIYSGSPSYDMYFIMNQKSGLGSKLIFFSSLHTV
jgi:hypothetical protein